MWFALVFPILFLLVAGIIQFGLIFWSQNTLTQIARDTGRWAATQQADCSVGNQATAIANVVTTANSIAAQSSLLGYTTGSWTQSNVVVTYQTTNGSCPPADNSEVSYITIVIHHQIPIFFPAVPGNGNLTTSTQFRMEPAP